MWPFSSSYPELVASQVGVPSEEKASLGSDYGVYDYIVIGGGTAGCVLASRLSEDRNVKVLLVERGVLADSWASRVPLISSDFTRTSAPALRWKTVPQKNANGQQLQIVAGKALGGTTRINSMLYTRGAPAEWDSWSRAGRKGWSYDEILPYFLKSERASEQLTGQHHGTKGEWFVRAINDWTFTFWDRFLQASAALGFSLIEDVNDPSGSIVGCARIHRTLDPRGKRHDVSTAFLPLSVARNRKERLKICTGTIATKIDIVAGEHSIARGVYIQPESDTSGQTYYAQAKREIILCSGAFGSPHLLLLSGVGPEAHLKEQGVQTMKNLRGVGEHLMDHIGVPLSWKVPLKDSLHAIQARLFLLPVSQLVLIVRSALLSSTSHLTPSAPEPNATRSADLDARNPTNVADLELIPFPLNLDPATLSKTREGIFSFLCILVQPKSRGTVRLASADPRARPITDLGTFTAPEDVVVLRKGVRLALTLARTMREQGWTVMQDHDLPASADDSALDRFICRGAQSEFHYSSTCRMAPEREGGVVDDELRVHGVDGLRVADASIFPNVLATHTQAPVVVVAEKCADLVRRKYASAA